jgi:vacuolar-type H+-ATPase subunit E/Vma4
VRQAPEYFDDVELELVYVAKKLKEALKVEELFTAAEIDYAVEPDTYKGGVVFQTERVGAFFYVAPASRESARLVLAQGGYKAQPVDG